MEAATVTSVEKEPNPSAETLALFYDEFSRALDDQKDSIESLNTRAMQLFAFSTVIVTIVAGVLSTSPALGTRIIFGCALPFFLLTALYSARAWEFRTWRADPDPEQLWEHYQDDDEEHIRHQVIQNRRKCLEANRPKLNEKVRLIKRTRIWLYAGFIYAAALLLYQVISG